MRSIDSEDGFQSEIVCSERFWKTLIINDFRFTSEALLFNNKQSIICVGTHGLDSAASNRTKNIYQWSDLYRNLFERADVLSQWYWAATSVAIKL